MIDALQTCGCRPQVVLFPSKHSAPSTPPAAQYPLFPALPAARHVNRERTPLGFRCTVQYLKSSEYGSFNPFVRFNINPMKDPFLYAISNTTVSKHCSAYYYRKCTGTTILHGWSKHNSLTCILGLYFLYNHRKIHIFVVIWMHTDGNCRKSFDFGSKEYLVIQTKYIFLWVHTLYSRRRCVL